LLYNFFCATKVGYDRKQADVNNTMVLDVSLGKALNMTPLVYTFEWLDKW